MSEKRIVARHRVLKAGTIEFGGGAIDCTVHNLSDTGNSPSGTAMKAMNSKLLRNPQIASRSFSSVGCFGSAAPASNPSSNARC